MTPVQGTGSSAESWRTHDDLALPPILAAALTDLRQHGYHGATVRAIAAGVGLTMPSLYYHYGNKEGILFALLDLAMDDLLGHINGGLEEAGDDTRTRFANLVQAVALHNTRRVDLARLHDDFRFLSQEARHRYVGRRSVVERTLLEVIEEGIVEGIFHVDDARFTSRLVLGLLAGVVDWYADGSPLSTEEIAETYLRGALRLVGDTGPDLRA